MQDGLTAYQAKENGGVCEYSKKTLYPIVDGDSCYQRNLYTII